MIDLSIALLLALASADGPAADGGGGGAPPPVAFVYVESNVGSASGGHSALRVGDRVYHYHHSGEGLLNLERDEWPTFRRVYAGLENRPLHVAELDVAPAAVAQIAEGFNRAFVAQTRDLDRLRRLRADAAWWSALAGEETHRLLPPLRGVGFLSAYERDGPDAILLRDEVRAALGESFLGEAIAQLELNLRHSAPTGAATDLEPLREKLLLREALRTLEEARPLAPGAVVDDVDPRPLAAAERAAIAAFRARLGASIVALLRSNRPDRGFPLAVAIARHQAASRSLACDRLITLDVAPDDAVVVVRDDPAEAAAAARVAARALDWCRELRGRLFADADLREPLFCLLEESLTRCREAQRGARGESLRLFEGRVVPAKGRSVEFEHVAAETDGPTAAARTILANARRDEFEQTLRARQAYALIDRNCATELVRTLNGCFPDETAAAAALGARLEPGDGFTFIPFMLDRAVTTRLRVRQVEAIPSHRLAARDELERRDPGIATALREATTLTSTIYTPREEDGAFLLFTDDALLLRPVAGVVNLGYGVVRGLGGLFTAPFDHGAQLRSGWNGALFSLPELVFCSVRKGTFRDVEPEEGRDR